MRHQLKPQGQILLLGLQIWSISVAEKDFSNFFVVAQEWNPVGLCWGEVSGA